MFSHVKTVFSKYVGFSAGRAPRAEYWYFYLFNFLVVLFVAFFGPAILGEAVTEFLVSLYYLAIILPSLAVTFRRLHDIDKSGWWILIGVIPFIGWIWFFILMATKGTTGANQYGPDPLASTEAKGSVIDQKPIEAEIKNTPTE